MKIINRKIIKWRNGHTAVDIREKGKRYQVIEHCMENRTPDGTGINQNYETIQEARWVQRGYAEYLAEKK